MSILASQQAQAWGSIIMWVVIMVVFVYFFMIRPQKKEAKKKEQMMSELAVGDTVLTTSGFYGIVIDVSLSLAATETAVSQCRKQQLQQSKNRKKQ